MPLTDRVKYKNQEQAFYYTLTAILYAINTYYNSTKSYRRIVSVMVRENGFENGKSPGPLYTYIFI